MTKVVIVDDHPVVREGLTAALDGRSGIEVAAAFGSAEEAIAAGIAADVVILDLELPGISGIDAVAKIGRPALILTAYGTGEDVQRALAAGAGGYLLKGAPLDEIERAIEVVAGGGSYIDPRLAAQLVAGRSRLTNREREVLRLIVAGESNKRIAAKLRIAERTAKFHVTSILTKLGAENRAQAVAIAMERRLV
jgi:two-component system, NarL family, response regulator LiaR